MARLQQRIVKLTVALAASAVLANCGGSTGGDGPNVIRLFFGMNNDASCNNVVVDVDIEAASAVLATLDDGDIDCLLNQVLDNAGCNASFSLINGGEVLHAVINGCSIPKSTNLFQCGFRDVDLSDLAEEVSSQCSCVAPGCDVTPPICVSATSNPGSCEDCDNNVDDDDNGFTDCEDPNCEHSPLCEDDVTTTTSTSSTTESTGPTITTTSVTITTTTLPGQQDCTLTFRLLDEATVGSLSWDTDYSEAPGEFPGTGGTVECTSLVQGALVAFSDNDATNVLSSGLVSLAGFNGPTNVAECSFSGSAKPDASDFFITVTDASTPDLDPIEPVPDVVLTSLDCQSTNPTTTLAEPTTTTIVTPPTTTTTVIGPTTTTLVGPTTTTLPPGPSVEFALTSSSAPVGALQFTIDYTGADGEFTGSGASVACTSKVDGALFAPNDNEGTRKLTLGFIALNAFSAPLELVSCEFTGDAVPGDFVVTIDDATDAGGEDVTVDIDVSVFGLP